MDEISEEASLGTAGCTVIGPETSSCCVRKSCVVKSCCLTSVWWLVHQQQKYSPEIMIIDGVWVPLNHSGRCTDQQPAMPQGWIPSCGQGYAALDAGLRCDR